MDIECRNELRVRAALIGTEQVMSEKTCPGAGPWAERISMERRRICHALWPRIRSLSLKRF